jgi:nitrate reductase gamma subunit
LEYWLEVAKGPLFKFCFLIMVLGLLRNIIIAAAGMMQAYRRAGDKNIPWLAIVKKTASWLFPVSHLNSNDRLFYIMNSFLFHVGLLVVPVFLYAHIQLWKTGTGISWPALPKEWADGLTLMVILTGVALVTARIAYSQSRSISRFQDVLLPGLIVFSFISGYIAAHPAINPFSYQGILLVHVLSSNFILLVLPFSKLTHMVLWPFTQLATELGWRFPPDAGPKIMATLGKEDRV